MNETWQIQDAKNKLSEVIARALKQGPQLITKHGEKTVVVISYAEYERLKTIEANYQKLLKRKEKLFDNTSEGK